MDEILASIRKIISEDPKPAAIIAAAPVRPPAVPATAGTEGGANRSASQIMAVRQGGSGDGNDAVRPARALKPSLDDDILDLMDEDRGSVSTSAPGAEASRSNDAAAGAVRPETAVSSEAVSPGPVRPSLNEMWTPREWSRPSEAGAPARPAAGPQAAPLAGTAPVRASEAPEARLEAAIAALGQSLSTPAPGAQVPLNTQQKAGDPPARPMVVASAPATPPNAGPRIDVVAVVNAATRAALAQRSADEQTSASAFAVPTGDGTADKTIDGSASRAETAAPARAAPPVEAAHSPVFAIPAPSMPIAAAEPVAAQFAAPLQQAGRHDGGTGMALELSKGGEPGKGAEHSTPSAPIVAKVPAAMTVPVAIVEQAGMPVAGTASQANGAGVQTLEDTVARLLRPLLRQWLDDNMPRIVEKAFKEELAAQAAPPRASKTA
jgi:cell pole-organizing protein PopZ